MKDKTTQILVSVVFGFIGAALFSLVRVSVFSPAAAKTEQTLTASSFNLVDGKGRLRGQLAVTKEGVPGLWLTDEKGVARGIFGLYEDGTGYLGLQDAQGRMIQLMRSFGAQESPLLIFKNQGQDMMITGLNPGREVVPFLMSYEKGRTRKVHFGKYEGP